MNNIIRVEHVSKKFKYGSLIQFKESRLLTAVDDVNFSIQEGSVLGLVGESGSGKTTLGKILAGFYEPDTGTIYYYDKLITSLPLRHRRRNIQMIFQDPFSSINPKLTVGLQLSEAVIQGKWEIPLGRLEITENVKHYLDIVGLSPKIIHSYPHQFSGGELQRIIIARALAMQPKLIIADEPVSSLDLSIQAQILNLLKDLKYNFDLSYLFISHDLAVISYMADNILVMKDGVIIEQGSVQSILSNPSENYTEKLIEALPQVPS
ncbi:MAG: ATP-binding cassette domain-containing protein [bacterium]